MNKVAFSLLIVFSFFSLLSLFWTPYSIDQTNIYLINNTPSLSHIFGTDSLGRDIFSLVLVGLRITIFYALATAVLSIFFAITISLVFLSSNNLLKSVISVICDILIAFPIILLSLILVAVYGPSYILLVFSLSLGLVFKCVRLIKPNVSIVNNSQFWIASKVIGMKPVERILLHLLPNIKQSIWISFSISFMVYVGSESAMNFVGVLGTSEISLGQILANCLTSIMVSPVICIAPAFTTTLLVWAIGNLFITKK